MELKDYPQSVRELLGPGRLPELGPGRPNEAAHEQLRVLRVETLFLSHPLHDRSMAAGCLAGLWLRHDFLDESHRISQDLETPEGSYWHALMHRREPDYGNSKYWFRRVGGHGIFSELAKFAKSLSAGIEQMPANGWDPFGFVDLCEKAAGKGGELEMACRQIQEREWRLLFEHCWRGAVGG